ncbi:hypothetical protein QJ854_gp261 [Moumouvirus goulette]|uniref:Uncharacterized protein n=1 Tax=Moumouvirus goulette TaxID=1247379 RepID=M1PNE7_9VIRU|nr:hypothetical protein QJ854_gp261 [Moumouvirus goulette]AGF85521.1 hypothetical protein glt_00716 [Moumouvirus goulette]
MYNYYKINYKDHFFGKKSAEEYPDLFYLFKEIYSDCCLIKSKDIIEKMQITKYYMNHPINYFYLKYDNGLIMYNENNVIKICDFFPEFTPMEKIVTSIFITVKNNTNNEIIINKLKTLEQKKPRKHKFLENKKEYNIIDTYNNTNTVSKKEILSGEENKDIILFKSDKNSYKLIKNDLDKGVLDKKDINAFFADKFIIFKLLESRGCLDLENNNNLETEYELFQDLYEPEENNIMSEKEDIYVPHNYHYISEQEKINHAKKYNMTVEEFENKYINNSITPINNITFEVERCYSENKDEKLSDSNNSSEDDKKNKRQVDPEFMQLVKNLY